MNTIKARRERKIYSAAEKGMAVLAVWSGRRAPARLSRQMGVSWTVINNWEKRALEGMLRALGVETRTRGVEDGELGKRLEHLLAQELATTTEQKEQAPAEK